ncbi:MAG TPA: hypothetical protein DIU35_13670 [Candidatus Latescibacteria bacterium]|nr:hypothetical protein [Candidatus Latescibacterota bacterium]
MWVSVEIMARFDKAPSVVERRKTGPEEENEELTRLGRPIREVKFQLVESRPGNSPADENGEVGFEGSWALSPEDEMTVSSRSSRTLAYLSKIEKAGDTPPSPAFSMKSCNWPLTSTVQA